MLDARVAVVKRERDRALLLAYETGMFAALAWGGELKPFESYLKGESQASAAPNPEAAAVALHGGFMKLKGRGVAIESVRIDMRTRQPIGTA